MGLLDETARWAGTTFTGTWTTAEPGLKATGPATGDALGEVVTADADTLSRSAARAAEAGRAWAKTREAGKTRAPARLDVDLALEEVQLLQAVARPGRPWGTPLQTAQPGRTSLARRVPFTGSTPVGRSLSKAVGRRFKKFVSELGGSNAFVVLGDAGVPAAAAAGAFGSFAHQGQICMAVGRHLVAASGDVDLGPVINRRQAGHLTHIVGRPAFAKEISAERGRPFRSDREPRGVHPDPVGHDPAHPAQTPF
ncbi:aldehyde dehydrogenase family protein [Amycolatopsis sp., V23-08]|uniref:Aldehyde dehydrogenase family protein n=1 Tax=Amycolatopsis heterodermiae TaxID=3110235 RepID=A0ABU5RJC4_9PSEU|nr:aldehyde dehydrogenase family protein [Amycolatopsis sp., V23-08]MEA5365241.1 aldehyde dehydrogenase family protein [Amycolatopsis sp., V23-08]